MVDLVQIPLTHDFVRAQIFTARLRASGFQVELLEDQHEHGIGGGVFPQLLVHAADFEEITAIIADEDSAEGEEE